LDVRDTVSYSKDSIKISGIFCVLAGIIRLGSEFFPAGTFVLCVLACVLLTRALVKSHADYALLEFQKAKTGGHMVLGSHTFLVSEIDPKHYLQEKCTDYSKQLGMDTPPKLLLAKDLFNAYAFSASLPQAKNGFIVMGERLMTELDKEEVGACLAHEIGHIHDLVPLRRRYVIEGLSIATPMITAFSFKLLSVLSQCVIGYDNHYSIHLVDWMLMLATTALLANQRYLSREKYADSIAVKLAGPLAVSSSMRALHTFFPAGHHQENAIWPMLAKMLTYFGMEDVFRTHPTNIKRMKI
jgi:Zn-dependent protease with chaperone function